MTTGRPDDDVFHGLADALRDGAPLRDTVAAGGRAAFAWRTVDAELAQLTYDSVLEPTAAIRSAGDDSRRVVFTAASQSVEIEVLHDRVVGQLLPEAAGTVTVESEQGERELVTVDDDGFFVVSPVPQGLIRFRGETATARVVSPWLRL